MNVTIEAYSPDGFKVTLQANCESYTSALRFSANAAKAGFTAAPPDLGARKTETITTVIRREHVDDKGKVTPVVDLYPTWRGEYGQFRFVGIYLNTDEDIRQFEQHSGLKLLDIPLYASQVPLQRKQARPQPCETACKPFGAAKTFVGEKDIGGKVEKVYKFTGYGEISTSAPVPDPEPAAPKPAAKPILPGPGSIRAAQPPAPSKPIDQSSPLAAGRR